MFKVLNKILTAVDGQKTNLVVTIGIIVLALHWFGVIEKEALDQILTALGMAGVYTMRDAMKKIQPKNS